MATERGSFYTNAHVGWTEGSYYYPSDFDPSKLEKVKKFKTGKRHQGMNIRNLMPFNMCCDTCGEFMYVGTKFNSTCEKVPGDGYKGVAMWRFRGKCTTCKAEFVFRTDPKTASYIMESGGKRSYEAFADANAAEMQLEDQKEREKQDAMQALEHKRVDMEREMQAHEDLESLMHMNKRSGNLFDTLGNALEALFSGGKDEAAMKQAGIEVAQTDSEEEAELETFRQLRRRQEDDELDGAAPEPEKLVAKEDASESQASSPEPAAKRPRVGARFAVKKKIGDGGNGSPKAAPTVAASSSGLGLGGYNSDDSD